jgi:hypothetical protein
MPKLMLGRAVLTLASATIAVFVARADGAITANGTIAVATRPTIDLIMVFLLLAASRPVFGGQTSTSHLKRILTSTDLFAQHLQEKKEADDITASFCAMINWEPISTRQTHQSIQNFLRGLGFVSGDHSGKSIGNGS